MKKLFFAAISLALVSQAAMANKFDTRGIIVANQYKEFVKSPDRLLLPADKLPFATDIVTRSAATATALVIPEDGYTAEDIAATGLSIIGEAGGVVLANGTMDDIIALAETDIVKVVSFGDEAQPMMTYARAFTGVDDIHNGAAGLPAAYKGAGVITGIFDQGFQPNHYNFKDADGRLRIKRFWRFTAQNGAYTELKTDAEILGLETDNTSSSHGTHTLGCMAGSCNLKTRQMGNYDQRTNTFDMANMMLQKPIPYYGCAPESEIVIGAGSLHDANMTKGIELIQKYAEAEGKPAVVNLSIGSIVGPRDGSDAFCKFVDGIAAKIPVFVAAGNDGDKPVSISGKAVKTFILPSNPNAAYSGVIDIWSTTGRPVKVTPFVYNIKTGETTFSKTYTSAANETYATPDVRGEYLKDDNFNKAFMSSYMIVASKVSTTNSRYNMRIDYSLQYNSATNDDHDLLFAVMVDAGTAEVDFVNYSRNAVLSSNGLDGWSTPTSDMSISSMACGKNVIVVGAWNTRNAWTKETQGIINYVNPEENGLGLDAIAGYSSHGTLRDGRSLPHFCAPGTGVISSVSTPGQNSLDPNTYPIATLTKGSVKSMWGLMQGTSMATPVAAGGAALWLQADPTLTPAEIRQIAIETCKHDDYTAAEPLRFGAGKFDALQGLKKVLGLSSVNDISVESGAKVLVTPTGERSWSVYAPGAESVNVTLYSLSGIAALSTAADGEEAAVDASSLQPGIYVMSINGSDNRRVVIR